MAGTSLSAEKVSEYEKLKVCVCRLFFVSDKCYQAIQYLEIAPELKVVQISSCPMMLIVLAKDPNQLETCKFNA